jgi:hypothetical protein
VGGSGADQLPTGFFESKNPAGLQPIGWGDLDSTWYWFSNGWLLYNSNKPQPAVYIFVCQILRVFVDHVAEDVVVKLQAARSAFKTHTKTSSGPSLHP